MQHITFEAIKVILKADTTIPPRERAETLAFLRNGKSVPEQVADTGPRLLRRSEAAARLGRTVRSIDQLCQQGILVKRTFPGRQRSAGILESSLVAAISATA